MVELEEVVDQRRAVCLDSFWASREEPYVLTYPLNPISSLHSASRGVWVGDWEVEVAECQEAHGPRGRNVPAGVWSSDEY